MRVCAGCDADIHFVGWRAVARYVAFEDFDCDFFFFFFFFLPLLWFSGGGGGSPGGFGNDPACAFAEKFLNGEGGPGDVR